MRLSAALLSLSFVILARGSAAPQQVPPVRRDVQAIATIQTAIDAMGGAKALGQVQTVVVQGSIALAPGSNSPSGAFVMEDQFTSSGHEFRDSFQSTATAQSFVSGHGNPGLAANGTVKKFSQVVADARLPVQIPGLVLSTILANTKYSITLVGTAAVSGQPAIQIHVRDDSDMVRQTLSIQDWYFDPSSGLPLRVEYRVPDTSSVFIFSSAAVQLSDFRVVQGVRVPFQIVGYLNGNPLSTLTISNVSFNQSVSSLDFDLPSGGAQ